MTDDLDNDSIESPIVEPLVLYPWQQPAWDRLTQQLVQQRLPHGLLLHGVANSGLESFAMLFARLLLCSSPQYNQPCGRCRECHLLSVGTHAGCQMLKPVANEKGVLSKVIRIDQVREIIDIVSQTSLQGNRKVIVIAPADVMNPNAANALLKSLEEPPANTYFILACNNPGKLMATIRSRCQLLEMPLPLPPVADQWLATYIADTAQRRRLLAISGNNPVQVVRWQQEGVVEPLLAIGEELLSVLSGRQTPIRLAAAWKGDDVAVRVNWWWRWLAAQLKSSAVGQVSANLPADTLQLHGFMQKLLMARYQLEGSTNPNEQLLLESLLIDWHRLAANH